MLRDLCGSDPGWVSVKVVAVSWPRLDVWPLHGLVRTIEPLEVVLGDRELLIPRSVYSDGASVPQALWPLLDASPIKLLLPGICHDATYRSDCVWMDGSEITRVESDDLLRALVIHVGCSELDAEKMRWAVGHWGEPYWHRKVLGWSP